MSEVMVGQCEKFIEGHQKGKREGYLQALEDICQKINGMPANYHSVSIPLINGWIDKLKAKK